MATSAEGDRPAFPDRALFERLLADEELRRFPDPVERAFRLHFLREGRRRVRLGFWTGLALFVAYAAWDVASFPPAVLAWSLPLRLLVVCPLYAAVIAASHFRERVALMDALRMAATLVTALVTTAIVVLAGAAGRTVGLEGLFLVTIATYTLTGLRTPQALACGLAVLPMELLLGALVLGSPLAALDAVIFSATANLIGFVACASQERTSRANFLRTQLLDQVAAEDPLTGLANRRRFESHLAHVFPAAARGGLTLVLGIVDVDHFKRFNDRHGHAAGDAALCAVARAISALSRRPLDLAARIGGEEFAIAWFDTRPEAARVLAEQLRKAVAELAIEVDPETGRPLTVSAGIVSQSPHAESAPSDALLAADEALYEAKGAGRDRAVVREL